MAGRWLKDALGRHLDRSWEASRGYESFPGVSRELEGRPWAPRTRD